MRRIGVDHGSEQINSKCWMAKSLAQTVTDIISALRVHLGHSQFLFAGDVVLEFFVELSVEVDLEEQREDDRGEYSDPSPRFESQL